MHNSNSLHVLDWEFEDGFHAVKWPFIAGLLIGGVRGVHQEQLRFPIQHRHLLPSLRTNGDVRLFLSMRHCRLAWEFLHKGSWTGLQFASITVMYVGARRWGQSLTPDDGRISSKLTQELPAGLLVALVMGIRGRSWMCLANGAMAGISSAILFASLRSIS